jgi:hypothetical protein
VRVALSIWRRLASSVKTGVLDIYEKSSIDLALKDAFRNEAISLISIAVDFGVTRGRWQLGHPRHHQEEPLHRRSNTVGIRVLEVRCRARRQPT